MEIALAILIGLNWLIYHKIFVVYYFGGMRKSLTKEFIWCAIAACFELAIFLTIGQWLLGLLIPIAIIVGIVILVRKVLGKGKKSKEEQSGDEGNEKASGMKTAGHHADFVFEQITKTEGPSVPIPNTSVQNKEEICMDTLKRLREIIGKFVKKYPQLDEDELLYEFLERHGVVFGNWEENADKEESKKCGQERAVKSKVKKIYCTNCGEQINIKNKFCPFCGAPRETEMSEDKKNKGTVSKIAGIVISVLVVILLWKAFSGDFDRAASEATNGAYGKGNEEAVESNSIESYISTVKNGYLGEYTDMTIGEMLDDWYGIYYNETGWDGGSTDDGRVIVEFRAEEEENLKPVRIQFTMYDEQVFRVTGYDDGTGKDYEPTEIGADLNYTYYNVHMLSVGEEERDEELRKVVEWFNEIPGSAVLYGASADYSGDRSELEEEVYGEAPLEMSVRELLDFYYDDMLSLAYAFGGADTSADDEGENIPVNIYGVYSYDNGEDAVVRAEVGIYTDDDSTYLSMEALSYGDRYLAYFDGILEPVEDNTYQAVDENFGGTTLNITFDENGMQIEVMFTELEECNVFTGYYEKVSEINFDEVG